MVRKRTDVNGAASRDLVETWRAGATDQVTRLDRLVDSILASVRGEGLTGLRREPFDVVAFVARHRRAKIERALGAFGLSDLDPVRLLLPRPLLYDSWNLLGFPPLGLLHKDLRDIDLVHALVRDRVKEVRAVGVGVLTDVDMTNAWLEFEGGAVANIKASRVARDRLRKLRLFQRNGYFSLDLADGSGEFYKLRADVDLVELAKASQSIEKFVERVKLKAPEGEPLRLEHEAFVAAIRGDVAACFLSARLATVSSVVQFASMRQAAPNPTRHVIWLQFGLARNLMRRPRCETVAEPAPIPDDEASAPY